MREGGRVVCLPLAAAGRLLSAPIRPEALRAAPLQGTTELDGVEYLYAAAPVPQRKVLVLLRPAGLRSSDWRPFAQGLALAGLVGSALAALVALLLSRAITRPVGLVAEASRSLAAGGSPEPVPVGGSDELAQLAASFNEMAAQLARARETERAFLLSVSHELKTPLTAIRGYAEGLADDAVGAQEAGQTIAVEAGRLERLVQDLLDLARLNRSAFAVDSVPVDLGEAAREVVRRYEPQARGFDVSLEAAVEGPSPALGDEDRVVQVVSNLVENALRSTPAGGTVRVEARPGEVLVEDTGPGLDPQDVPRAFERFYLFERHRGRRAVGTGLGLAIVKDLTEAMGGSVEVRSGPSGGARFVVRLPVPAAGDAGEAAPRSAALTPR